MPVHPPLGRHRIAGIVLSALLTLGLFAGCGTLDAQQRRWIFQPAAETWWAGEGAAEGMQNVWIEFTSAETGRHARLHGLWHPRDEAAAADAAPVLLYLHGARWDVMGSASRVRRMNELGFSVLAIDYRGFGKSSGGLPSEAMAYEDARAAWQWLGEQHPQAPRYIFGHSLGAAIAIDLAAHAEDEAGLIVEGSFTSIRDVVAGMRWGWLPIGPLISQRFDGRAKMERIGSKVLMVHGSEDRLIPPALGQALYELATTPKRWLLIEGGSHHSTHSLGQEAYRDALHELFGLGA
jgi:alpha-beta hydrolase superfamily lysophospholipase